MSRGVGGVRRPQKRSEQHSVLRRRCHQTHRCATQCRISPAILTLDRCSRPPLQLRQGAPSFTPARHVSLLHTSDWDDRVDEFTTRFCGVACAAVSPSVQLLTISAISLRHIRFTVNAIALHAPRPHKSFKVQIRLRQSLEEEHGSAIRDLVSAKLGIHAESVFIIQDDDAGVIVD